MQKNLNIFQFNVKLFNISGVIPSENINSSLWKSALFRIYQAISLLLFISNIPLQFLAIYHYWGNTNLVSNSIGLLVAFIDLTIISIYIIIFWKSFCDVMDTFERNSIFCNELVRSNQKHMKIVNEILKLAQIYNKVISMSINLVSLSLILPTFVQHLMTSDEEILQKAETDEGFTKHLIFVIWLPPAVKQKIIIRVMYGLQCICLAEMCLLISAISSLCIVLFLFTGTQFKLISSIIREIDEENFMVETPGNVLHEVPEQLFTADRNKLSDLFQSQISNKIPLISNSDTEEPTALSTEMILSSKMQQNILQEGNNIRQSERIHDLSLPEIKSTKNDPEYLYLLECIKLHQESIR